jgi:ABC-type transport system substrate-binding protein
VTQVRPSRRQVLASATAAGLARPLLSRAGESHTLRFIPQADVTILDPLTTTAYPTRNHGHMCWDTLYGLDTDFRPFPQLAAGHVVEDGAKLWTFTLRDGPTFQDGQKIRAQDDVASIRNPRGRKQPKPIFEPAIFKERFRTIERVFAWEDKFRRLLLRFERISGLHYAFKTLAYTMIDLRHYCQI